MVEVLKILDVKTMKKTIKLVHWVEASELSVLQYKQSKGEIYMYTTFISEKQFLEVM